MSGIFEPVQIGTLSLSNRLIMAPVKTAFGGLDGQVTGRLLEYYRRRAEGGVGAIIVEPLFVDAAGKEHPKQLGADSDDKVEGLSQLVAAIHDGGSLAIAHLNHAGRAANPKASGRPPEAPSEMACPTTGAMAGAMTVERIAEVVAAFASAARRVRQAGFDGVELQCGLGYLVAQFLSPRTNSREDDYGGNDPRRLRFASEVVAGVMDALGGDVPLQARISGAEQVEGGLTLEDGLRLARWLETKGVAALHVASGSACDSPPWYYQHMSLPEGVNAAFARDIRKGAAVPVIAAGRLGDPAEIERVLAEGWADLVAMGRPLVADPDLPRKLGEAQPEQVVRCGGCLQGCLAGVKAGKGIGCIVNPELGHEGEPAKKAAAPRKVVVVGGGPAGLTAARVAAERGHKVTLLERDADELGGQFALCPLAPGKKAMAHTVESLIGLARKSGADIRLGVEATLDTVAILAADVVVVATGAEAVVPPIPGLIDPVGGEAVLTGAANPGQRVLVIGGGLVGVEVAEFLAASGRQVTVVEMLEEMAGDMEMITRKMTFMRLSKQPVTLLTGTTVTRCHGDGTVTLSGPEGEQPAGPFDTVVTATGTRPRDPLSADLAKRGLEVHVVGDASELAQVQGAVTSAWQVARQI